ncbi:MAG: ATP-binding protein [Cellulosilyticum sp.]|nr:ATP-binding protein [Cellulosilyticum sp.]
MIVLITGASHTGKTVLAQKLLEKTKYPYVSIDHIKMGLIRSGYTNLTPSDDYELVGYLWPVVREMIKTAIENKQNLIVEGCYIPFDWKRDFEQEYLNKIKYICLILSNRYIDEHFVDIKEHANDIECRLDDSYCNAESLKEDNLNNLEMCKKYELPYVYIDKKYNLDVILK